MTVSVATIQRMTCAEFNIPLGGLLSARRSRREAIPRQAAIYLAKELTGLSMASIGRLFDRDHSTVIASVTACARRMAGNPAFAARVEAIRRAVIEVDGPPAYPAMLTAAPHRVTFTMRGSFQQAVESVVTCETMSQFTHVAPGFPPFSGGETSQVRPSNDRLTSARLVLRPPPPAE